jgi:uncharacterized protein (DUF342 family)
VNQILADNLKAIEAQVKESEDKIVAIKDRQKTTKEAIKIAEKIKDLITGNDVLSTFSTAIVAQLDESLADLNTNSFDDEITAEKDKIKKLNKALLALQEIDN